MNRYFNKNKRNIIVFLISIIILNCIITISFSNENTKMEVEFHGKYDNAVTQIFFDLGSGYSEENSAEGIIANGKAVINVPDKYNQAIQIRLDPSNINKDVVLESIKLSKYNKIVNWNGKDIIDYIQSSSNIEQMQTMDNGISITGQSEDIQIIFSDDAIKEFKSVMDYKVNIIALLLITDIVIFLALLLINMIIRRYFKGNELKILDNYLEKNLAIHNKFSSISILLTIATPAVIIYWNYIVFNKIYIFDDIGSDSYFQTFANIIFNSKYMYNYHFIPMWSFNVGLGQNFFTQYLDPFNLLLSLSGEKLIPYLLGVFQFLKVILSGLLFYKYLKIMGISRYASIISSLGYAFCGQIIDRGSWVGYPNEVLCVAAFLLSFELFYKKQNIKWLPISVAFIIITLRGYYFFLYSGILIVYAVFRYLSENKFIIRKFTKYLLYILIIYIIGVLMSSIYLIPNLILNFSGSRVSSLSFNLSNLIRSIFSMNTKSELITAYARTISHSLIGVSNYKGSENLLEDPLFYCGIITLLIMPQVFVNLDKKKKIYFGCALGMAVIYILSPGIRYIVGGMATMQFKVSSFWVIVVFLYLSAHAFNDVVITGKINTKLLLITVIAILTPLSIIYFIEYQGIEIIEVIKVVIFISLYCIFLFEIKKYKYISKLMILAITIIEAVSLSYPMVNERSTIGKESITNKGYYDSTNQIIDEINTEQENNFYRISKNYNSVFLCDSLAQNYYGTKSYQGGSSHSKYIIDFIKDINAPLMLGSPSYILGFNGYNQINTMLGVKYILSKSNQIPEYGYESVDEVDGINVLKNKYSLPLGYAYSKYITDDKFKELTEDQKKNILLKACVLNKDSSDMEKLNLTDYEIEQYNLRKENIVNELDKYNAGEMITVNSKNENDLISISFDTNANSDSFDTDTSYEVGDELPNGKIYWSTYSEEFNDDNVITFGVGEDTTSHIFEINQKNIKNIKIETDHINNIDISNIKISSMQSDEYYKEYRNNISELKENKLNITSFQQNNIKGNIELDEAKMLFFSIPYDKGWSLKIDGKPVELENVNIGFMGAYIADGYHEIELSYMPPMFKVSTILSIVGMSMYIVMLIIMRKNSNKFKYIHL